MYRNAQEDNNQVCVLRNANSEWFLNKDDPENDTEMEREEI